MKGKKMKLDFEMYADVRFNRDVNLETDVLSPGGYTMIMSEREVTFDFEISCVTENKDKCVISVMGANPDYEYIETDITADMLHNVESIEDFFVFTGENGETDLRPVSIENITFVLHDNGNEVIKVNKDVCEKAKVGCALS